MNNMEYTDKEYCLEIWGDWACFTRPELKVERVELRCHYTIGSTCCL